MDYEAKAEAIVVEAEKLAADGDYFQGWHDP